MNLWSVRRTRRWQRAIVVFAAFSILAYSACGVLRYGFPTPHAASSQTQHIDVGDAVGTAVVEHNAKAPNSPGSQSISRHRPATSVRSTLQELRSSLPVLTPASVFQPPDDDLVAPVAAYGNRDILTRFCIARL